MRTLKIIVSTLFFSFPVNTSVLADEPTEYPPGLEGVSHANPILVDKACVCRFQDSDLYEVLLEPSWIENHKHVIGSLKFRGIPIFVDGACNIRPRCGNMGYKDGKFLKSIYFDGPFEGCIENIMTKSVIFNGATSSPTTTLQLKPTEACQPWP